MAKASKIQVVLFVTLEIDEIPQVIAETPALTASLSPNDARPILDLLSSITGSPMTVLALEEESGG